MFNVNFWLCCLLISNSIVSVILAVYAFSLKQSKGSLTLGLVALATAVYSFGYGLELASTELAQMLTFNLIQYLAIPFFAPLWLIFSLQIAYRGKPLSRYYALLFVIPAAALALRYTSSLHHLYYIDPHLFYNGSFATLAFGKGPFYHIHVAYILACILSALYLNIVKIWHSAGFQRSQFLFIVPAQLTAILPVAASVFDLTPWNMDLTPFALPISIALLLTAILRYRFLNPAILVRSKVFEWSNTGMMVLDTDLNLMDINPAAIRYCPGYSPKYLGLNIRHTLDRDGSLAAIIDSGGEITTDMIHNGEVLYFKTMACKLYDRGDAHIGYMISMIDLTHHMNIMKKLEEAASTDALTGVMTRRTFDESSEGKIEHTLRQKSPVSFLILDIDNFKSVNDTCGHPAGDELLKGLAGICRQNIRESDLLGRMGGDEFVVLFPDTGLENAKLIGERIRQKASAFTREFEDQMLSMTVSVGVAGVDSNEDVTLQTLYKYADEALYCAKNGGRNRVECRYVPDSQDPTAC